MSQNHQVGYNYMMALVDVTLFFTVKVSGKDSCLTEVARTQHCLERVILMLLLLCGKDFNV